MRTAFIKTLEKAAKKDKSIFLLSADLGFKVFDGFRNAYPARFINVGVAEANMIGVAAGLSLAGGNVYCYSIASFLTTRCLEQIRIDLCYHNLNVKLIGVGGGLTYGFEGMTHHAVEDVSLMRSLPNMAVVSPGDPLEAEAAINESVHFKGPLYIRLGRDKDPIVHRDISDFKIGKGIVISKGEDICIFASGSTLYSAKAAADALRKKGLDITLISMHTIKPLDKVLIEHCAGQIKAIFTIEEHSIIGGLGSAVAEVLAESRHKGLFRKMALPDKYYSEAGSAECLRRKSGLNAETLTKKILKEYKIFNAGGNHGQG